MNRKFVSVKSLCAARNHPYHELCYDEAHSGVVHKKIGSVDFWDIRTPYIYCGLVEDVHIFGRTFLHSMDDTVVFHCQSYQNHEMQGVEECIAAFVDARRPDLFKTYVEEECIFLGGTWTEPTAQGLSHEVYGHNFGHFIFEYLNRLAIFDLYGLTRKLPVVIYDCLPERWIEFIELMGIPKERLIRVPIVNSPAYRKVWVSSSCHYRDSMGKFRFWGGGLHWLRFRLLSAIGGPRVHERRRLYLGREGARWRKVVNEDAVKQLLAQYGFEFLPMGEMSARAQLEAISGAELVVSTAGAGSILLHFAPEHCINILLAPRGVGTGPLGGLAGAVVLRQVFDRIDCASADVQQTERLNSGGANELADFKVDLTLLQAKVEAALQLISSFQLRDALKL